jgi:co-chaperonin GroES (HSP10)
MAFPPRPYTNGTMAPPILRAVGDAVLLESYQDTDKYGRLYIPPEGQNSQRQQGEVVSVGREAAHLVKVGDWVLHHPFRGTPFVYRGTNYIHLFRDAIAAVARELDGQWHLEPLPGHVLVRPEFPPQPERGYYIKENGVYRPRRSEDTKPNPPLFGTIENIGEGVEGFSLDQRIMIPPEGGAEIGFVNVVYYTIPATEIVGLA